VLVDRFCGANLPWGTLVVNVLGCFLFGILWSITEQRLPGSLQQRLIVLTGFMGAFTTFSTFAHESGRFLHSARYGLAIGHFAAHNLLGITAMFLGYAVGTAAGGWLRK
jgi:fluoride exporter